MRAIVQRRFGGPEALREEERGIPVPGAGEVVVRVAAAGVDAGLVHLLEGRPFPVRLAARPPRDGRVLGLDVAGVVHAVGEGVTTVAVGDEVFGVTTSPDGSLAEFARARADRIAPRPADLSLEEAAATPVSATTALRAVRDAAQVQAGQRVLVLGAGGGVGHFAVQIAKALGAHVTGASSARTAEIATSAGVDRHVDYTREDPLAGGPFDAIVDTGGHRSVQAMRRALAPAGALVLVGSEPEGAPLGGLSRSMGAAVLSPFTRQRLVMLSSSEDADGLRDLSALAARGALRPVITARHALGDAARALAGLGRGKGAGKSVVLAG